MYRIFFNHILPFVLGSLCGIAAFYMLMPFDVPAPAPVVFEKYNGGGMSGACFGKGPMAPEPSGEMGPLSITSNPRATYTAAARENSTAGSVLLKVTLLANGEVGSISTVRGLPDGLTEQAIAAARKIEFTPKKVNGVPVTTVKTFEYNFSIY